MREPIYTLIAEREHPCVSLYLPMVPGKRFARRNATTINKALVEIELSLQKHGLSPKGQKQFLATARTFAESELHDHPDMQGLALFLSPSSFHAVTLEHACSQASVIGARFHITPLFTSVRHSMHYYILAVSKKSVRFLEVLNGNISQKEVEGMPKSIDEAWEGMERQEKSLQFHSTGGGTAGFHGQGGAKDVEEQEEDRFIKKIAKSLHTFLHEQHDPLIFAGVEEEFGMFRKFDESGKLLNAYIQGSPDQLKGEELVQRAEPLVHEWMLKRNEQYVEEYGNLQGTGRTSTDLGVILDAAVKGKVDLLFLPEGGDQWGHFNTENGKVTLHDQQTDQSEELMGLAASHTLDHRGRVIAVEQVSMPENGRIAAILRL